MTDRHDEVRYADDQVPRGLVLKILFGFVAVGAALCVVAYLLLRLRESQLRPDGRFPEKELGPPRDVATLRSAPFELASPAKERAERQRAAIHGYGWVDRARGLVRIPIDEEIELMVRGQK